MLSDSQESLESPQAKYLVGWSHGKEILKPNVYDTHKGSYYVNCAFYQDRSLSAAPAASFPEYTAPNVWPPEEVLPAFQKTFEELCTLIIDTAVLVARACDRYAEKNVEDYEDGYLERVVKTSFTTKARLLHYFPPTAPTTDASPAVGLDQEAGANIQTDDDDSWCATHVDHGCLTGLTSALYINESAGLPEPSIPLPTLSTYASSPDSSAGLYIRSRTGKTTKVGIPVDCLGFQTGEALERITKGKFRAVPHFVRAGSGMDGVARNTLAVFTQPNLGEVIDKDKGITFAEFSKEVVGRNT